MYGRKEKNEKIWAKIFKEWINENFHVDYEIYPGDESGCDMVLKSDSGYDNIYLELTFAFHYEGNGIRDIKPSSICEQIESKSKNYSKEILEETILLVQTYLSRKFLKNYLDTIKSKYKDSHFKGIYLIVPKNTTENANVYSVKETFI